VHDRLAPTAQRVRRILDQRIRPAVHTEVVAFNVESSSATFEPGPPTGEWSPFDVGSPWGDPWHTTWFRLVADVPKSWSGGPVVAHVDLGFHGRYDGFQAEGLVRRDGRLLHAIQPDRREVLLHDVAVGGEHVELLVEAASNPVMSDDLFDRSYKPTVMGDPATAPRRPIYVFRRADLALVHADTAALVTELHAALDLLVDLSPSDPLRPWIAELLEGALAVIDLDDVVGCATAARSVLAPVFTGGGSASGHRSHRIIAVGHAHLDTAWLWPVRETRRKALRTFANAVDLLERRPEHRFAHSQAQHYAWVAQDAPEVFARVQALVAEGRFEPVGGMWVEADLNGTGGESLVRQLLHGQRAFESWFGRRATEGFLPDDFGYPGSLPQILHRAGCRSFFTQKLSWNETNRFPHHTFSWEGIDGTQVLTHFSPVETYNCTMRPAELRFAERNFADHARSTVSLVCFGHGDGGGGPTAQMIDRAMLAADACGVPPVVIGTVGSFFDAVEAEAAVTGPGRRELPVWVGEMYLEKHRGTFTSQLATKQGDARCERLLREAELWGVPDDLGPMWERLLVGQFHDILPGSSIAWVHREIEAVHRDITRTVTDAIAGVLGDGGSHVANPAPADFDGVAVVGGVAMPVAVPAFASIPLDDAVAAASRVGDVTVHREADGGVVVDNGIVRIGFGPDGTISTYDDHRLGRSVLNGPAGFVVRPDQPAEYDAWDIDEPDARHPGERLTSGQVEIVESGHLSVRVRAVHTWRRSRLVHEMVVRAGSARVDHVLEADWHESERRVSFAWPVDVHAREATCGVQFGHVRRARHSNTSWDAARFEVCAHRFVHVGEHGGGAAILVDSPRGFDVRDGGLALSLLRAPRYPDPNADRGSRRVTWSTWTHTGDLFEAGIEREVGYLGFPLRTSGSAVSSRVRHDLAGVVVEAVKSAADGSGDTVVRLWESRGGRAAGRLVIGAERAWRCNLLEDVEVELERTDGGFLVGLRPFEIVTVRAR
jgi:alpha-mannosidase